MLPEEATHFSDAVDKILWTKYHDRIKRDGGDFVPVRIGGHAL